MVPFFLSSQKQQRLLRELEKDRRLDHATFVGSRGQRS